MTLWSRFKNARRRFRQNRARARDRFIEPRLAWFHFRPGRTRLRLWIDPVHAGLANGRIRFGLKFGIGFGRRLRLGRNLVFSQLTDWLGHNWRTGKLNFGRRKRSARFLSGGVHQLGLERSPLIAGLLNCLTALGQFLPFGFDHRLEFDGASFLFRQLVDWRSHPVVKFGFCRAQIDASLRGPSAGWTFAFVVATILV